MKKGLGKIRKIKKKHIFLALLAVIVLGGLAKAYSAWVGGFHLGCHAGI